MANGYIVEVKTNPAHDGKPSRELFYAQADTPDQAIQQVRDTRALRDEAVTIDRKMSDAEVVSARLAPGEARSCYVED